MSSGVGLRCNRRDDNGTNPPDAAGVNDTRLSRPRTLSRQRQASAGRNPQPERQVWQAVADHISLGLGVGRSPTPPEVLPQSFNFPTSIGLGSAPPHRLLFVQVRRDLNINDDGPSARRKLLRLLTTHFDDGDQGRPLAQLTSRVCH